MKKSVGVVEEGLAAVAVTRAIAAGSETETEIAGEATVSAAG